MSLLPIRALIIEDHPFKRLVATKVFQELGCLEVTAVADEECALELLKRSGPVDVALCTLKPGCTDGLTTIEILCKGGWIKSIIISSINAPDLHSAIDRMVAFFNIKVLGYIYATARLAIVAPMLSRYLEVQGAEKINVHCTAPYKLSTRTQMEDAIANKEIKAFFQPKFNLVTGEVNSFEVLARWEHSLHGLIYPIDFLPILTNFDLMDELLFAQIEQGLAFLQEAELAGHVLSLSFNLQCEQLGKAHLLNHINRLLDRYDIQASRLVFEITESGLLELSSPVLESFIRLRMIGVGLAIDDFGVGYSSLERLCQLPFTEIKLDAGFTRNLESNRNNRAVVSSTLALGAALNMSVVVEGVESEPQRQVLIKLGCTQAQGYLCARPMSANSLLSWLELKLTYFNKPRSD